MRPASARIKGRVDWSDVGGRGRGGELKHLKRFLVPQLLLVQSSLWLSLEWGDGRTTAAAPLTTDTNNQNMENAVQINCAFLQAFFTLDLAVQCFATWTPTTPSLKWDQEQPPHTHNQLKKYKNKNKSKTLRCEWKMIFSELLPRVGIQKQTTK